MLFYFFASKTAVAEFLFLTNIKSGCHYYFWLDEEFGRKQSLEQNLRWTFYVILCSSLEGLHFHPMRAHEAHITWSDTPACQEPIIHSFTLTPCWEDFQICHHLILFTVQALHRYGTQRRNNWLLIGLNHVTYTSIPLWQGCLCILHMPAISIWAFPLV